MSYDEEKAPILTSSTASTNSDDRLGKSEFTSYGWRWINLALFCALSAAQNFLGFAFAPIANIVVEYYEETGKITTAHVNFLNAVTLLTAIPLFIWGPPVITRNTLKASIVFLVAVDVLGGVLRYIFSGSTMLDYWFVFLGQGIMSLGQVVTWAGPTKLAMVWFPDKERAIATSLASMSNLLGIATAYLFCPIIVPDGQPERVKTLLMIQMIVCLVLGLLCVVLFKSTPPSAPSKSSTLNLLDADGVTEDLPEGIEPPPKGCWGQYKALVKSVSFDLIAVCFGLGFGYFNGLFTVLNSMMTPLGYSGSEVGLFGVLLIVSGVVGAAVSGVIVGRTHKFKEVTCVCLFLSCFAMLYFALSVKEDNLANICASLCCLGFFALAITPVALEVSVEYTYPIPVSTSSGALCAWGSFLAVIMIVIMTIFVDIAHWLGVGGFVATFFVSLFMGTNYKRQNLDNSA